MSMMPLVTPYQQVLIRLRGFSDGAGSRSIPPEYEQNDDYNMGYSDGRKARHEYAKKSATYLGVTLNNVVAQ